MRGFTVIELVLTLVIIGVMAVVASAKFFSTSDYNRKVYYDELLNSIRYARKLAIATNTHIQVDLTPTSIALRNRIEGSNCTTGTTFTVVTDPANKSNNGYVKAAPGQVTLNFITTSWPIYFNGLGQALLASNCNVLSSTSDVTIVNGNTIKVTGETGLVK